MKAVVLERPGVISVNDVPDPQIIEPTDAIVKVTQTAICGADLLPFHGHTPGFEDGTILGHEFVGQIVEVGSAVTSLPMDQRVVNTSTVSDGTCDHCRQGPGRHPRHQPRPPLQVQVPAALGAAAA